MDTRWVARRFDARASTYDHSEAHRWQARHAVDFLGPAPGERVLDVATGTGMAAREVSARLGAGGAVVGIDVAGQMLRTARRAHQGGRGWFVQADAAASPFGSETFDAVLCVAGVPYFPDLVEVLRDWRRVARPRARAVITVPTPSGITTARVLRQAANAEGIDFDDPGGVLADPHRRGSVLAAGGWQERQIEEVALDEPTSDPTKAFGWADSGFAEPLRTAPAAVRKRVWSRFETQYAAEPAESQQILLIACAPAAD